jgi:HlyD family secretion protein
VVWKLYAIAVFITLCVFGTSCGPSSGRSTVSGTIETDEVRIASRYGGRVQQIYVREGDNLTGGQLLVQLDAAELLARRDLAAAQLAEMEAGPRREEIDSARHDWEALSAELENARAEAKRADQLFAEHAISATDHDAAVTRSRTLEKNVASSRSKYDLLLAGTRAERIAQARAQVADIETQIREMKISAPSNVMTVLEVLSVKPGDVVSANREVATLLMPEHLWVRVYVAEPWLGKIRLGDSVQVRVDSDPGKDFAGVVEQIAREAEFTPRNVQTVGERIKQVFGIKIRLGDGEGKLRAGMSADVFFPRIGP